MARSFLILFLLLPLCTLAQFEPINFKTNYSFSEEILATINDETPKWKFQILASDFASIGQDSLAMLNWDKTFGARSTNLSPRAVDSIRSLYTTKDAISAISDSAQNHEIVIINESHQMNKDRYFTANLLESLNEQGYRHLGLEGLNNDSKLVEELNMRGYVNIGDGYYLKSPAYTAMVNKALGMGFYVFAYEADQNARAGEREEQQHANINAYIKDNPEGKYLIYCGFDHALEGKHRKWERSMAERLKQTTGKDPFTVDQVKFSDRHKKEYKPALLKALAPQNSSVVINKEGKALNNVIGEGYMDLAVMHPFNIHYGKMVELPSIDGLDLEYPVQIQLMPVEADPSKAAAVKILELTKESAMILTELMSGNYQIIINDITGKAYQWKEFVVE